MRFADNKLLKVVAVVLSWTLVVAVPAGVVVVASEPASAATPIDRCTTIRNSGTYELTRNIESGGTCITILASDVTFDGQGHSIQHVGTGGGQGIWVVKPLDGFNELENVVVRDVTVTGFTTGILAQQSNHVRISRTTVTQNTVDGIAVDGDRMTVEGNTARENKENGIKARGEFNTIARNTVSLNQIRGIYVRFGSNNAEVYSNTVTRHGGTYVPGNPGILLRGRGELTAGHVVEANTLSDNDIGILVDNRGGNTIRFNSNGDEERNEIAVRIQGFSNGNEVSRNAFASDIVVDNADETDVAENSARTISIRDGDDNVVFDNDVRTAIGVLRSSRTSVVGNAITGEVGLLAFGVTVEDSRDTTVRGNVVEDRPVGIKIQQSRGTDVRFNRIANNTVGVKIFEGGAATTTLAANNIVGNSEYGVENEVSEVVDARFNYWGASNGPSSASDSDAPFADPVTGRLADGDGDAVSESPVQAGVSNVRFHPWSRSPNSVTTLPPFKPPTPITPPSPIDPPTLPPIGMIRAE